MSKFIPLVLSALLILTADALTYAQTANTFPPSGNVGIGTTSPRGGLDISSNSVWGGVVFNGQNLGPSTNPDLSKINASGLYFGSNRSDGDAETDIVKARSGSGVGSVGGINFYDFNNSTNSFTPLLVMKGNTGNIGVGTTNPVAPLSVYTASNTSTTSASSASTLSVVNATPNGGFITNIGYTNIGISSVLSVSGTSAKAAYYSYVANGAANNVGLYIDGVSTGANYGIYSPIAGLQSYFNGAVGIGTTSPSYALDIVGKLRVSGGIVFPDGSVQTKALDTSLCSGGDYAESVDVVGDRGKYGPGDVLVIDPDHPGKFLKSAEPYSAAVLGVYSTKPGVLGRRQTTPKIADEVPMAMVGIVPTKVSAENGSIKPGDLLVSATTSGHAMKGTDRSKMLGAVIGKALGNLDSGTGVMEVGITLQ